MFSEDFLKRIKETVSLSTVIGERHSLKKNGRGYIGLCPFHNEKTPSFHVSDQKQFFYCFGCKKTGDIFTYLKDIEGYSFTEAVKYLCEKFSIEIESSTKSEREALEVEIIRLNTSALKFWAEHKTHPKAVNFFKLRGFSENTIEEFGLGYSLDEWSSLLQHAKTLRYTEEALSASGLFADGNKGNRYDRFRDRIIIPFKDIRNRTIGFGGRALGNSPAKYINSPETMVYKKGEHLFGLNLSKDIISQKNFAIISEGYFDFISLWESGIKNVVATLGTAFTAKQAELLKRFTTNCVLCFDGDPAGYSAAEKACAILVNHGFTVKVMLLPQGEDADSFVKKHGAKGFNAQRAKSLPLVNFKINSIKQRYNLANATEKAKAVNELGELLRKISNLVVKRELFDIACEELAIARAVKEGVWNELISEVRKDIEVAQLSKQEKLYPVEKTLLEYAAFDKDTFLKVREAISSFSETSESRLLGLLERFEALENLDGSEDGDEMKAYIIASESLEQHPTTEEIQDCVNSLRRLEIEKRLGAISEKIAKTSTDETVDDLLKQQLALISLLKTLG